MTPQAMFLLPTWYKNAVQRPIWYRANPKDSRNPKFCVGCFELIISKIFAMASKMGKNYFIFAIFFCGTHFCVRRDAKN